MVILPPLVLKLDWILTRCTTTGHSIIVRIPNLREPLGVERHHCQYYGI